MQGYPNILDNDRTNVLGHSPYPYAQSIPPLDGHGIMSHGLCGAGNPPNGASPDKYGDNNKASPHYAPGVPREIQKKGASSSTVQRETFNFASDDEESPETLMSGPLQSQQLGSSLGRNTAASKAPRIRSNITHPHLESGDSAKTKSDKLRSDENHYYSCPGIGSVQFSQVLPYQLMHQLNNDEQPGK